ncbi:unnamed protein product [Bemisia tabaci]|uniref:Uncharacterized protein n=1 Tax=Bemisia tabaci TaxID=7038 RepID=A0A9P0F1X8_BEMTA|nr:unnamed protein product [Bemisia tabaci]
MNKPKTKFTADGRQYVVIVVLTKRPEEGKKLVFTIHIQQALEEVQKKWDVRVVKIPGGVTDNAPSIVKAVRDTLVSKDKHIPCSGHELNVVAEAVIEEFIEPAGKMKPIVTYGKHSLNFAYELRDVQIASGRPVPLKLLQAFATRSNSYFEMIDRFLVLHKPVDAVLIKHPKAPPMITAQEVQQLKETTDSWAPLMKVTKALSQEKYVTASKTIPLISCLFKELEELKPETEIGERITAEKIKIEILRKDRFGDLENREISICSTILDPRYKRMHLRSASCTSDALTLINRLIRTEALLKNAEKDRETSSGGEEPQIGEDSL